MEVDLKCLPCSPEELVETREIALYCQFKAPRSTISQNLENRLKNEGITLSIARGELPEVVKEGEMIVNAWDPHSIPGNGNDKDNSFDGVLGKHSAIGMTQSTWMNPHLKLNPNTKGNYTPFPPVFC